MVGLTLWFALGDLSRPSPRGWRAVAAGGHVAAAHDNAWRRSSPKQLKLELPSMKLDGGKLQNEAKNIVNLPRAMERRAKRQRRRSGRAACGGTPGSGGRRVRSSERGRERGEEVRVEQGSVSASLLFLIFSFESQLFTRQTFDVSSSDGSWQTRPLPSRCLS
jgi:hypothetical protein